MKKVLFLMFLLLLTGLGAADVKAQVRIGGNVAPNAATVLDLNTNNNANPAGNKGLGLPRVTLANDTTMLTPGVANLNGMMVCNTTNTLGGVGLYYWSANSAKWVKVNLPPTSASDSGKFLMSNGSVWIAGQLNTRSYGYLDTFALLDTPRPATVEVILDTTFNIETPLASNFSFQLHVPGIKITDICTATRHPFNLLFLPRDQYIVATYPINNGIPNIPSLIGVRCLRVVY